MKQKVYTTARLLATGALTLALGAGMAGCASSGDSGGETGESQEVKQVVVGVGVDDPTCSGYNDDGELEGFEIELIEKIDEELPQYEFGFDVYDFANILLALDGDKVDIAVHQYEWSEEREQNYLFAEVGYLEYDNVIAVIDEENYDTSSFGSAEEILDFLASKGATTMATAGGNSTAILEAYNEEHPDAQIGLDYAQLSSSEQMITNLATGKWNFLLWTDRTIAQVNAALAESGLELKVPNDIPISESLSYFIYQKDDEEAAALQQAVDEVLQELIDSGYVSELSVKWFGSDYSPQE